MKLGIIGTGNIGGALVQGLLDSKKIAATDLLVADTNANALARFAEQKVGTLSSNSELAQQADVIVLAVKPAIVESVLTEIRAALNANKILVSVAAGVTLDAIEKMCEKTMPLFRVIPNTALAVGQSMTFIASSNATEQHTAIVTGLFDSAGETMFIAEEQMMAAMALSSCGIAFAMRYVSANMRAGVEIGFAPDVAKHIVLQTLQGAVSLLTATGAHPEAEIDRVTTPKGFTIKGLNALEHNGFSSAIIDAVKVSK
ncbi:pyrroline-5-carboxylate reductase [Bacteroidia bacterium]|nr:pyrroline-5-carboxylate reductase [Bacteroidia bacterium]